MMARGGEGLCRGGYKEREGKIVGAPAVAKEFFGGFPVVPYKIPHIPRTVIRRKKARSTTMILAARLRPKNFLEVFRWSPTKIPTSRAR